MSVITAPTPLSQWQDTIVNAQKNCAIHLPEALESYLVFALMRFTRQASFAQEAVGMDYLTALSHNHTVTPMYHPLRDVGDRCLITLGLFPEHIHSRHCSQHYYHSIGVQSYYQLSLRLKNDDLFEALSQHFNCLSTVLKAVRTSPDHQLIQTLSMSATAANDNR